MERMQEQTEDELRGDGIATGEGSRYRRVMRAYLRAMGDEAAQQAKVKAKKG